MRLLCISDIHDNFEVFPPETLPEADLCLVAGDLTNYGVRGEWQNEIARAGEWLRAVAARHPVFWIPGNHDIGMDNETFAAIPNCTGILDQTVEFGGLRVHGVSMAPCYDKPFLADIWDYMTSVQAVEDFAYAFEPVDVVVSHSPPYGYCDQAGFALDQSPLHIGSRALRRYIEQHAPRLVLCGHVHEARGHAVLGSTEIYNVAGSLLVLSL